MNKFILVALLLPITAVASFNGSISGSGTATMHPKEKVRQCSQIFMQIKQDASKLHVIAGGYICEDMQASFPDFTLDIVDQKLVSEGTEVGTITDNEITLHKEDTEEDFTYKLLLKKENGSVLFEEQWTDGGQPALTVEGHLL